MVDSNNNSYVAEFEQELEKEYKKSEVEGGLSFYDCPTAAASIQGFSDSGRIYHTNSCDSDQDYSTESNENLNASDGGSVSFSRLRFVQGGYFGGCVSLSYPKSPKLTGKPLSYISNMNNNLNSVPSFGRSNPVPTVLGGDVTLDVIPESVSEIDQTPKETKGHICADDNNGVPQTPLGNAYLNQLSNTPSAKDYSRAVECSNRSETTFVQEGYDTISVPRYRPVEIVERTVEVPVVHHVDTFIPKKEIQEVENIVRKPYTKYVEKVVQVPQVHYTDRIVEVPEYHEITKTIPKIEVQERTKYVPKIEVKVIPKYVDVPIVKIVDKYEEVEEVEEVIRHVERREVVEVPREVVKHVVKPVRKLVEQERIIPVIQHRDVPIEKIKFVPKIETVELIREIPQIVEVPVPYNVPRVKVVDQPYIVPKYRDVPVAVPVMKKVKPVYKYSDETEYIDVPVHRPYFVIHDHLNFKPVARNFKEHLRVVGMNRIDLETLDQEHKADAQNLIDNAVLSDDFKVYRDSLLKHTNPQDNYTDVYPPSANATPRN